MKPESRLRVRLLEDTGLLPKGKDLKAQVVAGAEEDAEPADHADEEGESWDQVYTMGLILVFAPTS